MENNLVKVNPNVHESTERRYSEEQVELIKSQVAVGATNDELSFFLHYCRKMSLDPLSREVYFIKRKVRNPETGKYEEKGTIQVGIDGFRKKAEDQNGYDGTEGPFWCGADGKWKEVWLERTPPAAAMVRVYRKDRKHPFVGVAVYREYVQTKSDGSPTRFWKTMPASQLGKCAEALALRKAFPRSFGGVFVNEEMDQADSEGQEYIPPKLPEQVDTSEEDRGEAYPDAEGENFDFGANVESETEPLSEEKEKRLVSREELKAIIGGVSENLKADRKSKAAFKPSKRFAKQEDQLSEGQWKSIWPLMRKAGISEEDVKNWMLRSIPWFGKHYVETGEVHFHDLHWKEYRMLRTMLTGKED